MIEMPPRHGKSELTSRYFPAWFLRCFPEKRVILSSYEADFAAQWGRKARTLLEEYGGPVKVSRASSAADRWELEGHGGGMQTSGIRGPITGKGADVLIIDDPVKNDEEARSQLLRERNWDWYTSTARTRLEPGGGVVLIMTRWHEDDLAGRLEAASLEGGDQWRIVKLPAIAEGADPLGRSEGEALWPARYDEAALEKIRVGLSPYHWQALYQQSPTAPGGNIIKGEWWRFYDDIEGAARAAHYIIQSWDTAFKVKEKNDYSVCTTWAELPTGAYLLDVWRGRVEFPDLVGRAKALINDWHPGLVVIEDKASGQSLAQSLQSSIRTPILPMDVDGDKPSRVSAITLEIEGGRVFLPRYHASLRELLAESAAFPNGTHDDIVDSMTMALTYMKRKRETVSRIVVTPKKVYKSPYA
jgi:predicted phage terminase large subunit-like protein